MGNIDVKRLWENYVDTVTKHYVDFAGRVGVKQYWYFILVSFVIAIVLAVFSRGLADLYNLAVLLPTLGLTVRRLQDTGKPGSWVLIAFIPLVLMILLGIVSLLGGALGMLGFLFVFMPIIAIASLAAAAVLIYLCIQPGQPEANQYGPVPPVFEPGAPTPAV
ncbi:MAG TPA: DUF805 domain-containing protein [Rhizomicrobium sp.]|jgi:uncharacterized membrane protein YhaH (DUF805 family)|nr:DUF805 domain-containing protein [Rhizomicrobium sp.]